MKVLSHIDFSEFSTLFSWIKNKLNIDENIRWRELRTNYHVIFYLEIENNRFGMEGEALMVSESKDLVYLESQIQFWDKVPTLELFFEKYKGMFLYRRWNCYKTIVVPSDELEMEIANSFSS